jgi:hypothetical protein
MLQKHLLSLITFNVISCLISICSPFIRETFLIAFFSLLLLMRKYHLLLLLYKRQWIKVFSNQYYFLSLLRCLFPFLKLLWYWPSILDTFILLLVLLIDSCFYFNNICSFLNLQLFTFQSLFYYINDSFIYIYRDFFVTYLLSRSLFITTSWGISDVKIKTLCMFSAKTYIYLVILYLLETILWLVLLVCTRAS